MATPYETAGYCEGEDCGKWAPTRIPHGPEDRMLCPLCAASAYAHFHQRECLDEKCTKCHPEEKTP